MSDNLKLLAYGHIRRKLIDGSLRAGEVLNIPALAAEVDISRTPVREAITMLACEGFLEQVLRLGFRVRIPTVRDIDELFELRLINETAGAALAAQRSRPDEIDSLRENIEAYRKTARQIRDAGLSHYSGEVVEQIDALDIKFHILTVGASKNRRLLKLTSDLHVLKRIYEHAQGYDIPSLRLVPRLAMVLRQHYRIFKAIEKGNAEEAAAHTREHLEKARRFFLSLTEQIERQGELSHIARGAFD